MGCGGNFMSDVLPILPAPRRCMKMSGNLPFIEDQKTLACSLHKLFARPFYVLKT